jgi:hypothetical protein
MVKNPEHSFKFRVLTICLIDSIIGLLEILMLTRFSSKHQSAMLTRFLTMLSRYAK